MAAPVEEEALPDQQLHSATNPLLIDIILDKVFQCVADSYVLAVPMERHKACKEMLTFRLVCQLWRDRATSALRKTSPPVLFGEGCDYEGKNYEDPDRKLSGFLEIMRSSTLIPVNKFHIGETICVAGSGSKSLFAEFMELCGPQMVKLSFEAFSFINLSSPLENLDNCSLNLKLDHLKILNITDSRYREILRPVLKDAPKGLFFQFLQLLLGATSTLEEFGLSILDDERPYHEEKAKIFYDLLKMLPPTVSTLKLETSYLHSSHLDTLTRKRQTLKKLELVVKREHCCSSDLYKLVESQSGSLTDLQINEIGDLDVYLPISEFPVMKELTYLSIYHTGNNHFPTSVCLPKIFPKLTKLSLLGLSKSDCNKLVSGSEKMLNVVEISFPFDYPPSPWMKKVTEFFPNLKKLHVPNHRSLDTATVIRDVFRNFVHVEELRLLFHLNEIDSPSVDSIFSGVADDECRRIMADGCHNLSGFSLKDFQREPSILNLTKLRKLELRTIGFRDDLKDTFTEFSGHCVFSKLAALEEMHLGSYTKMTAECKTILKGTVKKFFDWGGILQQA